MDCDIAEPPTTLNPGHPALARRGSVQDNAAIANEPRSTSRPNEDRNRGDLHFRPQGAAENQVEDEQRAQGVVAPLRPTAILRYIMNTCLEEPIDLSFEEREYIHHHVASEAYRRIISTHRIALSKTIALALRRKKTDRFFIKNRIF